MKSTLTALLAICLCLLGLAVLAAVGPKIADMFSDETIIIVTGFGILFFSGIRWARVWYIRREGREPEINEMAKFGLKFAATFIAGFAVVGFLIWLFEERPHTTLEDEGAVKENANKTAFGETRTLAKQGDAIAQRNLGRMYALGEGVPQDHKEAVKWYRKAAEQGDARAQLSLGVAYRTGQGVEKDDKEAVKWYRKAAEQGYARAQFQLGLMYFRGAGVAESVLISIAWLKIAETNGDLQAKDMIRTIARGVNLTQNLPLNQIPDQIVKGEQLSREMIKKNPKLLGE